MLKFFVILVLVVVTQCNLYERDQDRPVSSQNIKIHHHPSRTNYGRDQDSFSEGDGIKFDKLSNLDTKVQTAEVCAKVGCIRGKVESGRKKPYDAFYGIPYAEPPVGKLRLENPVPHKGWSGHWDATYARSDCIQRNFLLPGEPIIGAEDCLYLNVYRPAGLKKKLPVFVYIHGGWYQTFSGHPDNFGPEYLMDNGEVILVTMNYRLGLFGFLCSGDGAVKGNFGLKDQQMALKWVSENIEAFGGDPHTVTLGGNSVGAVSTSHHLMNPVSSPLFHRAMLSSGSATGFWAFGEDSEEKFRMSAKFSGFQNWDTATSFQIASQLKKADVFTLILAHDDLIHLLMTPPVPLRPCLEGNWEGAFITQDPRKVWAEGRFPQKPMVIGVTTEEGAFAAGIPNNETRLNELNEKMYELLPIQLDYSPKRTKEVLDFYLNGKDKVNEKNADLYYKMFGERIFVYPVITAIQQYVNYADTHKNPLFIYEFGFTGRDTVVRPLTGRDIYLGVSHLDDMMYLLTMKAFFEPFEPDSPEGNMSDVFVRTLVDFMVHGEVKAWAKFKPCSKETSKPFCDYQAFSRKKKPGQDSVLVTISNDINLKMVDFWNRLSLN